MNKKKNNDKNPYLLVWNLSWLYLDSFLHRRFSVNDSSFLRYREAREHFQRETAPSFLPVASTITVWSVCVCLWYQLVEAYKQSKRTSRRAPELLMTCSYCPTAYSVTTGVVATPHSSRNRNFSFPALLYGDKKGFFIDVWVSCQE